MKYIAEQDLVVFFTQKMNPSQSFFGSLSLEGYYCIQTFFILMNKRARRLILLEDKAAPKFTSYSSENGPNYNSNLNFGAGSDSFSDPGAVEVMVKSEPNEMDGI